MNIENFTEKNRTYSINDTVLLYMNFISTSQKSKLISNGRVQKSMVFRGPARYLSIFSQNIQQKK